MVEMSRSFLQQKIDVILPEAGKIFIGSFNVEQEATKRDKDFPVGTDG